MKEISIQTGSGKRRGPKALGVQIISIPMMEEKQEHLRSEMMKHYDDS